MVMGACEVAKASARWADDEEEEEEEEEEEVDDKD